MQNNIPALPEPHARALAEIGALLHSQDNRITSAPVFLVERKVRDVGIDPGYTDLFLWIDEDASEEVDSETAAELEATWSATLEAPEGYRRIGYRERWEYVTTCFTEQACKDYIAANGHNLGESRIYVASGWRNREWQDIRAALMALAKT